jgi:hypothetical protein
MRDVYLDFRLPWPAKIAAGMLTPKKWRPFEIYLTTIWTAPYFDHTYLGFSSIKSNGFLTKTKEASIILFRYVCFYGFEKKKEQNYENMVLDTILNFAANLSNSKFKYDIFK